MHRSTAGHAGPVYACAKAGTNNGYLTAGKDGFIMLWDGGLHKLKQVRARDTGSTPPKCATVSGDENIWQWNRRT